jgi:DNA-binding beta-propeller fold protein YncE
MNAYVASDHADSTYKDPNNPGNGDAVSEFSRNPATGALTQLPAPNACIKDRQAVQSSLTNCPVGKGLLGAFHVAVSPDGAYVYVGGSNNQRGTIAEFSRNQANGALTQLTGNAAWLSGNSTCNGFRDCTVVPPLLDGDAVTFSHGGSIAYDASFHKTGQVIAFNRSATTGVLSFSSCVRDPRATTFKMCTPTTGYMAGPRIAYVSPDDQNVYVPSSVSYTLDSFRINP